MALGDIGTNHAWYEHRQTMIKTALGTVGALILAAGVYNLANNYLDNYRPFTKDVSANKIAIGNERQARIKLGENTSQRFGNLEQELNKTTGLVLDNQQQLDDTTRVANSTYRKANIIIDGTSVDPRLRQYIEEATRRYDANNP